MVWRWKKITSLKHTKINDTTLIINATESTNNRDRDIYELSRKRDTFSNDVNGIRNHKNNLKLALKDGRSNSNRTDRGLEDIINTLLHKFDR